MASDYRTQTNQTNNNDDRKAPLLRDMSPSPNDWENWREKGGAPLSAAVLLSMNIHPTQINREALSTVDSARNKEFKRRYGVAMHRYGRHSDLPVIEHVNFPGRGAHFVVFDGFLAFAKEMGWDNLDEFEANLFTNAEPPSNLTSRLHSFEDLPKGEKYDQVRMGALLELLEKIACGKLNSAQLASGDHLNMTAVAKEIRKIIESHAQKNQQSATRFGVDGHRKHFAEAQKALRDFFKIT